MVHGLAQRARLPAMPEVGIYDSPEVNAFATGPSKSRSLVAVSRGLLHAMRRSELEGVLGHEIAHIANGDMVTMTLIQGVINAFVMFLARILAFAVSQAMRSRDDGRGGNYFVQYVLVVLFEFAFSLLGFLVVCWFSRAREFRADAGGARYSSREHMIGALEALRHAHKTPAMEAAGQAASFQTLKISGKPGHLFSTHPPIEERIARLQNMTT
jgi:heat shock protein HtpX